VNATAQSYGVIPERIDLRDENVGVVNDYVHGCFRATDYRATAHGR
jgi:hypothetical protein